MGRVPLFVYGSLKRGGSHHDELCGSRYLGTAQTAPRYRLERLRLLEDGPYFALVEDAGGDGSGTVAGELFDVPEALLPRLDAFEGPEYSRFEVALDALHSAHFPFALAYFKKAR